MSHSLNVLRQPKPFYLIFFLEFWERFGYYGLQSLLAVYLVRELGVGESKSFVIFGAFSALVYGLVAIGGYVGDKVLGTKRTIFLGALILTLGYVLMTLSGKNIAMVYFALGTIAVGNGFFKANPASLLAKCYEKGDRRLNSAFTMYYMAINIGSFISMAAVPYIADTYGWSAGFMSSAIGLAVAILNFLTIRHWIDDYGSEPDFKPVEVKKLALILIGACFACFASAYLLRHLTLANILLCVVGVGVITVFIKEILLSKGAERSKMLVALVLMAQGIIFFVMYMQMPTSLNFFTINNVDTHVFGYKINPITFQSLNPLWIMIISPVLAYIYSYSSNKKESMPIKFAFGMVLTAISFLVLPLGAKFADIHGMVSAGWIVGSYLFQAVGELLISGLGLAMVAQLVPERLHGFIMGVWFLTTSVASVIAGYVAGFASVEALEGATALDTLPFYSQFFKDMGLIAGAVGLLMFIIAPKLNQMIHAGEGESD